MTTVQTSHVGSELPETTKQNVHFLTKMSVSVIKREFVDRRVSTISNIPSGWEVGPGYFYQLDMKMCQIQDLVYDFRWGENEGPLQRGSSITEHPSKVLVLNISLNDLVSLGHGGLAMFSQLRVLDASLNRINKFAGVEVLRHLYGLNLAHNHITRLDGLERCQCLTELNLSMNRLTDISSMPCLNTLSVLHLNNNQLKSLDGIQALSQLKELYVQRNNLTDILPLSTSLRLTVLHAADNQIRSFHTTLDVVRGLRRLQAVCFYGNPIEKENNYQSQLLQAGTISTLDNISVRPQQRQENNFHGSNLETIKEATRQAFREEMRERRMKMEESARFLQGRINALHQEYGDYESRMMQELETCLRYLEGLSVTEARHHNINSLRERVRTPEPRNLWQQPPRESNYPPKQNNIPAGLSMNLAGPLEPKKENKRDYSDIKSTDEVLRNACNELARST